jgi:phage tail tape-measure protein
LYAYVANRPTVTVDPMGLFNEYDLDAIVTGYADAFTAGGVAGAAVGSAILPVVGTVIGGIVGGVVGSIAGQTAGSQFDAPTEDASYSGGNVYGHTGRPRARPTS